MKYRCILPDWTEDIDANSEAEAIDLFKKLIVKAIDDDPRCVIIYSDEDRPNPPTAS